MIFVSDLHIDNGAGPFSVNRETFMDFLDFFDKEDLTIVGDCLDLWRWSPQSIVDGPNRHIINRLRQKNNVMLILGNHDFNLAVMREIFRGAEDIRMQTEIYGYTVLHGHTIDPLLDTPHERFFAEAGARIIEELNWPWLNKVVDMATSGHRSNGPLKRTIEKQYATGKFIVGHSHVPTDEGWFLNAGTWTGNDLHYIKLYGEGARLHDWRR